MEAEVELQVNQMKYKVFFLVPLLIYVLPSQWNPLAHPKDRKYYSKTKNV